jgi:hypothetical protein
MPRYEVIATDAVGAMYTFWDVEAPTAADAIRLASDLLAADTSEDFANRECLYEANKEG